MYGYTAVLFKVSMTKEQFEKHINNFEFSELFRAQGWDNFSAGHKIEAQGAIYALTGIAQKKNFPILQCVGGHDKIPDLNVRKMLEKKVRALYFDHLLIFINKGKTQAFWQLPLREDGKIKKLVTFSWHKGQDVEGLFQKLRNIVFTLDEEDIITLADVKERVNTLTANSEKVIKAFYAEFSKQHKAFLGFIKGIEDAIPDTENNKKQWYASLMLNRLMFCYFIQKKGFLDNNINYLPEKLKECKKHSEKNNFYGFYRSFLLELFHNELGKPEDKRKKSTSPVPFGVIPYLNGGLFDIHELESAFAKIAIKDEAFERVFAFFDEWNWHLDTRVTASGKDINPDVIGYIFEKYINQKEMGAYYTKEDITDYIGKNTIVPFLLDKVKSWYSAPFESGGGFWQYLQDSGDEYIYDSVKKGGEGLASLDDVNIPENIRIGIDTQKPNLLDRRKDWNTVAPDDVGLPTEIWRETISRLQRFFELREKIAKGTIQEINGLITFNLNIRKLMQDYLEQTQDAKFVRNFYKALCEITILDPTCGSGAFLFSALNILEPLYEVCIQRMEEWYKENPKGNTDFKQRLEPIHSVEHPNLSYYIFKTIILNNLYGVDLMKEAVEIAKLRLFLKLVAEVDPSRRKKNYGLEPLPDIDFNIRSGNTLVGFATEQQLEEVVKNTEGDLIYREKLDELKTACKGVALSYQHFQIAQISFGSNSEKYKEIKKSLIFDLRGLDEKLNRYLADTYGLGTKTQWKDKKEKEAAYQAWKESHQPFHWFAEFYGIISKGGFDVVIGNPPYVAFSKINYRLIEQQYKCYSCKDIFALVLECAKLLSKNGNHGFIIPLSGFSIDGMQSLRNLYLQKSKFIWNSYYSASAQPSTLFNGVRHRLQIILSSKNGINDNCQCYTTNFIKWFSSERNVLFNTCLNYVLLRNNDTKKEKISNRIELAIIDKIHSNNNINEYIIDDGLQLFYHNAPVSWHKVFDFIPFYSESGIVKQSSHLKSICFPNKEYLSIVLCLLNSSLFYWYNWHFSNCRDLSSKDILGMKLSLDKMTSSRVKELLNLSSLLMNDLKSHSKIYKRVSKGVETEFDSFYPMFSKSIIDKIDKVLAKHYGLTEEELDFIINYDIKYRMGSELEGEE